jgi:hypothetical protein
MRRSGVRFPEAALRSFGLTVPCWGGFSKGSSVWSDRPVRRLVRIWSASSFANARSSGNAGLRRGELVALTSCRIDPWPGAESRSSKRSPKFTAGWSSVRPSRCLVVG